MNRVSTWRRQRSGKEPLYSSGFGVFPDYFWRLWSVSYCELEAVSEKSAPLSATGQSEQYQLRVRTHATREAEGLLNRLKPDVRICASRSPIPPDDFPKCYTSPRHSSRKLSLPELTPRDLSIQVRRTPITNRVASHRLCALPTSSALSSCPWNGPIVEYDLLLISLCAALSFCAK